MFIDFTDSESGMRVLVSDRGFSFYFENNLVARCDYVMSEEGLKSFAEAILKELGGEQ
jgi:hypothetical protein